MLTAVHEHPTPSDWPVPTACPVCTAPLAAVCRCAAPAPDGCGCVVGCGECGHRVRVRPEPALVGGAHYDATYHTHRKTEGTVEFPQKAHTFRLHLDALRRLRPRLRGLTMLDVGCATGDFLVAAAREGIAGRGVELSAFAAARAGGRGLTVRRGTIEDVDDGPFDVVHASHVLEHVPDVLAFARRVATLLAPRGLAIIEVPNEFDDVLSTLRRRAGRDADGRPGSPHLHFFSAASFARLFAAAGLVERAAFTYSHPRQPADALSLAARLRWVHAPNLLLAAGDATGRGRNLVLVTERVDV